MKTPEPVAHFRALESPEPVRRYLALKAEVKRLTEELKAVEPEVWDAVDEEGGAVAFDGVTLEACVSRTYAYSEAVTEAEKALRAMKAKEREAGATVEKATGYVRVTAPKLDAAAVLAAVEAEAKRDADGDASEAPPARLAA